MEYYGGMTPGNVMDDVEESMTFELDDVYIIEIVRVFDDRDGNSWMMPSEYYRINLVLTNSDKVISLENLEDSNIIKFIYEFIASKRKVMIGKNNVSKYINGLMGEHSTDDSDELVKQCLLNKENLIKGNGYDELVVRLLYHHSLNKGVFKITLETITRDGII